jgi:sarcosine oxidase gamma subunit
MFRSYASAFGHWLAESAAEYGLAVNPNARG